MHQDSLRWPTALLGVLSEVELDKPPRGPTIVSYSIRHTVGGE
jgi:hypothetical protein